MLKSLTEQATKELLIQPFQTNLPVEYPFKHIHLHHCSSLTLHEKLKDVYQGRFTKTAPAAIEMHLTLDLVAGTANYVGLDANKESEKHHRPFADELKDTLVLIDAGYFDIEYCKKINQFNGFYLMRAGKSINPEVVDYLDPDTHERISCHKDESGQTSVVKLNKLNIGKDKLVDLTVKWWKFDETFRVIQF